MPFTNDPDYLNSPDDCQTHYCDSCGRPIEDDTAAKFDPSMSRWFCASCCDEIEAENVPQDWTDQPLTRVNWTPRKLNHTF